MALNRLENFLKSARGKILRVNPENLDSTDAITNDGSSPFTPFKTINRALMEASRYSYQIGFGNDRFNFCTILLYSGEHLVDNRPGAVIEDDGTTLLRNGSNIIINQFDINTVLDITDPNNKLYLLNSVNGGLIVPRGTSIIAQDLRKTIVRPLYVPDSKNNEIERSAIFRITGASFFYGFSVLDANPTGFCYRNYNTSKVTPNYSHHKLTAFEYVDGVNKVKINDSFIDVNTTRTDLDQYYEKISLVYGVTSGRLIDNVNYVGGVSVDIQPVIDEYRIVGPRGDTVGISSIISGDGITPTKVITVTLNEPVDGISVDTSVQISDVNVNGYDGQFVVSAIPSFNQIEYVTSNIPTIARPLIFNANLNIISDTISSASPYIFNVSLRSVYGMCGLHADGNKVIGFKSVVVAQFTAVSLQKDNDAFVIYNETSGNYVDSTVIPDLYKNTRSRYKPEFENYHIKVSNDSFAQLVSVFSIGYATQIVAESGGDYSITNSNSNFGAKTFISSGYKKDSFDQDDHGYIIGVIPPEEVNIDPVTVEFTQIDIELTKSVAAGIATTSKLYLYNQSDLNSPPNVIVDGFTVGGKINDTLHIEIPTRASSRIVIPNTDNSHIKSHIVQRQNNNFENSITNGVITLIEAHKFESGEKVRILSQNGHIPDGIEDRVYYIIESSIDNTLSNAQIKLATTYTNAINNIFILPNRKGGVLSVVSRVQDKIPNDPGHPVQWDSVNNNWYVTVSQNNNGIYSSIRPFNIKSTGRTYIIRIPDRRINQNKLYKLIYSIPRNTRTAARPPINGYIIQESNNTSLSNEEFEKYFGSSSLTSNNEIRDPRFISDITWNNNEITVTTELSHKLNVGDLTEIVNVTPVEYNGTYTVLRTPTSRSFVSTLTTNPGRFSNDTRNRNITLPYIKRKEIRNVFQIYKSEEIQKFIRDKQDGVYELTIIYNSISPTVTPFTDFKFSQPLINLYPQLDRDNLNTDPDPTVCFAESNIIGNVLVNDPQNSITKESLNKFNSDLVVGFGVTGIVSNSTGTSHTIYTSTGHGLAGITSVSIVSAGTSYISGTYYGVGVGTISGGQAASFKVVVDGTQRVSSVSIMEGGSNYSIGNQLSIISGIGTTTGFIPAVLSVTRISDSIDNSITVSGFDGNYLNYNETYRINSITNSNQIIVSSASTITGFSTSIIPTVGAGIINSKIVAITSLTYNNVTGISTVTLSQSAGIKLNSKIRISGFDSNLYNQDVIVTAVKSLTEIEVKTGISSLNPSTSGSGIIIPLGITPIVGKKRNSYYYAGISTTSGASLSSTASDSTPLNIRNANITGLTQGDYIEVNGEIMRIKSPITTNLVPVYRAVFGTERLNHPINSLIRKVQIIPIEFRRNSIIRASGHTFEYVGYGPGNYSTALPENQDREISTKERLLSQSTKLAGGTVYYSGMDENGDFYSGNRKLSSSTGNEEVYDLPIPTVVGEETSTNIIESDKLIVSSSINVNGGENNDAVSEFNGPVILTNKLTSYSPEGIETTSLFLQGDQEISRRYSISENTPTVVGNYGDILYRATPNEGENIGWVYTTNNRWKTWGYVGDLGTLVYLYSGTESTTNLEGIVDSIKFVGDPDGFGIDIDIQLDPVVGFATIILRNPIDVINFGTDLGRNTPKFTNRSVGTRLVYQNTLNTSNVDYAVGISANSLWSSIPINDPSVSFKWFAGETEIASLSGVGNLTLVGTINASGAITGNLVGNVTGNLSGTATSSITSSNLNRSVVAGAGLTGGGVLNGQSVTLDVGTIAGGGIQVNNDSIQVDSTVVRTSGSQTIAGIKTFTDNISVNGTLSSATFSGNGITPIGGIIMWNGTFAEATNLQPGWALCDGRTVNGRTTPDLRNRFIIGSAADSGGISVATVTGAATKTGGSKDAIVVSHTHGAFTDAQGNHAHSGSTDVQGDHNHGYLALLPFGAGVVESGGEFFNFNTATSTAGAHAHNFSTNAAGLHGHNITVNAAGGSGTDANLPPYYALAFIMRTA
jgi:hypothetical protein